MSFVLSLREMNTRDANKIAVGILIIAFVVVFKVFNLGHFLTLSHIKASQESFTVLYASHRAVVIAAYATIYILVTSLSLPGAVVMTLAAGAIFGFWLGTLVVSVASSIGATIACGISRFLFRGWVQVKFGDKFLTVKRGIEKEGAFYVFALRLIPIFPFFAINLIMGLSNMPLFRFYWVSQCGMLPGTMIYVNAGKELARIESVSGILSPSLIASLVLLGLCPIAMRKVLALYRARGRKPVQGDPNRR